MFSIVAVTHRQPLEGLPVQFVSGVIMTLRKGLARYQPAVFCTMSHDEIGIFMANREDYPKPDVMLVRLQYNRQL